MTIALDPNSFDLDTYISKTNKLEDLECVKSAKKSKSKGRFEHLTYRIGTFIEKKESSHTKYLKLHAVVIVL